MEKFDYKKISIECLTPDCTDAPNDNPFFKKKVVFTGDMGTWECKHWNQVCENNETGSRIST